MSRIIEILLDEHRNIEKLLHILEQELEVFDRGESPDYEILQAIIDYFQDYPGSYHHPKEDIVFEKLKLRDPAVTRQIGDAEAEHQAETNRLRQFARAVEDVAGLRQAFHNVVRDFIQHQRQHIAKEERSLFPSAVKALRPEDWIEIDTRLNERILCSMIQLKGNFMLFNRLSCGGTRDRGKSHEMLNAGCKPVSPCVSTTLSSTRSIATRSATAAG
jgi:hemerythrin-like domain-containing protein